MLKTIIYLFQTEKKKDLQPQKSLNMAGEELRDFWLIEGPRAYRQSITSDKIFDKTMKHQNYWP
ncbi:hypothetical protein IC619_012970 [Hazenella sp. IB182353]|uniref:hypothetical protein n=1 Tax=Polycladospora coralii TaxID=2771432 RepID=UPI0017463750|nr:hypothetical protein [Polycladospora coralii]MBS7531405.1 hypothetical protein [Polycladospora coralii]